jgi:hypothetical protein
MMVGPTTNPDNLRNMARLQGDFEDLFATARVDLVLQGVCEGAGAGRCVSCACRRQQVNSCESLTHTHTPPRAL